MGELLFVRDGGGRSGLGMLVLGREFEVGLGDGGALRWMRRMRRSWNWGLGKCLVHDRLGRHRFDVVCGLGMWMRKGGRQDLLCSSCYHYSWHG
jgi:hypothetical protein